MGIDGAGIFKAGEGSGRFVLTDVHDIADNVLVAGWLGPDAIDRYFRDCKDRGIEIVGWRLSGVGDFLHHSKIENSSLDRMPWTEALGSKKTGMMKKHDFLELGAKYSKKHGILFFPFVTMCDEGWFPRFKFLSSNVEKYYKSEGFDFIVQDDDYILKPGIQSLDRWIADPDETSRKGFLWPVARVSFQIQVPEFRSSPNICPGKYFFYPGFHLMFSGGDS